MKKALVLLCFAVSYISQLSAQHYPPIFVNAGPDIALPCGANCTKIGATHLPNKLPTSYTVTQITYDTFPHLLGVAPPAPFYTQDDFYSSAINMPFNFCFFGNSYNQAMIGNNSMISFNLPYASGPNPWPLTTATGIPSVTQQLNSIMGPYMDIFPGLLPLTQANYINYVTLGSYPNRRFVVSYYRVPFYSCATTLLTSQIVLYETTNVIEIHIGSKPTCPAWNGGLAIEGIQDATGTNGYAVPGRNNSVWTATNDAYRFTPNTGADQVTIKWYQGGALIGTGDSVTVCPPNNASTVYVATATYPMCDGSNVVIADSMRVNVLQSAGPTQYLSCPSPTTAVTMAATGTGTWTQIPGNPVTVTVANPNSPTTTMTGFSAPGTYLFEWTAGLCVDTTRVVVTLRPDAGPDQAICRYSTATMAAAGTGVWTALSSNPAPTTITSTTNNHTTITGFTAGGSYSYVWTTNAGCSDTVVLFVPPFSIQASTADSVVCLYSNTTVSVASTPGFLAPFYVTWLDSTKVQNPHATSTPVFSVLGPTYFHVEVVSNDGCKLRDSVLVTTNGLLGTNIRAYANPTVVCPGSPTQLVVVSNPTSCGLSTSACTGNNTVATVGTGTSSIGGTAFQYPAPYGNYFKSAHHQFLIHANELLALLGGVGGQLKSLAFNVGAVNSATTLTNFTIKLACVQDDTMPTNFIGIGALQQVYTGTVTPVVGWNTHTFQTPYDWDGSSNLLVDICFENSGTISINNKVKYTTTPYKSVWVTMGNTAGGLCNIIGSQGAPVANTYLYQRPNMQFNVCVADLTNANLLWTPSTGPDAPIPNNQDTVTAQPVNATNYMVTLTNQNGCVSKAYAQVNIDTTTRLTVSNDTFVCSISPVQLHATVSGSAAIPANIVYTWTASTGTAPASGTGPGFANPTVNPTVSTKYTVTISGGGACTITDSIWVRLGTSLPIAKVVDSIKCAGQNNGAININMVAGTAPYTYTWNPAQGTNVDSLIGLSPGTYYVTVSDGQGCIGRDTTTLTAPTALSLRFDSANIKCYQVNIDSIRANVSGGRAPYTYAWTPASGNTNVLTNVPAGNYALLVTDAAGCTISGSSNITQPTQLSSGAGHTDLTAAGSNDGTLSVTTSGGTPGYTYSSVPAVTGLPNATGLDTGLYIITVCDANNCCVRDTAHIGGPGAINVSVIKVNNLCPGQCNGSLTTTVSGGIPPYRYAWNTSAADTTNALSNLCAGSYTLVVTDSNGITVSNTYVITTPTALTDRIDSVAIACYGVASGSLTENVFGGTPPYTIVWTPGGANPLTALGPGMYHVSVTDANGCTLTDSAALTSPTQLVSSAAHTNLTAAGSNDGTITLTTGGGTPGYTYSSVPAVTGLPNATGLDTGLYIITVCDAHNCCVNDTAHITGPPPLTVSAVTVNNKCAGQCQGFITAAAAGGVPPYTYAWSTVPVATTDTIGGLCAGSYTIVVTDSNGTTVSGTYTITTPTALTDRIDSTPITCFGELTGGLNENVFGGTPPYTIAWTPGGANPLSGIGAGTYRVLVTDGNGCTLTDSATLSQPTVLTVALDTTYPARCHGQFNGSATITAAGGTPSYTYLWSGGASPTNTAGDLGAGPQSVQVTDANGCTASLNFNITEPATLQVTITPTAASCATSNNGSAIATVTGGTLPYGYSWDGAAGTDTARSLPSGAHSALIIDANGCQASANFTVDTQYVLHLSLTATPVSCYGGTDGTATVTALNGTATYTYNWSAGANTALASSVSAGEQVVTVTDAVGCIAVDSVLVNQPAPIVVTHTVADPLCTGSATGRVWVSATGGTAPYNFTWGTAVYAITDTVKRLNAGTYIYTVTDGKGCSQKDTVTLTDPPQLAVTVSIVPISCANANDGKVIAHPTGGTPGYSYNWAPTGVNDSIQSGLAPGIYQVTVTDANGCSVNTYTTLVAPPPITFLNIVTDSTSCPYLSDGHIVVDVVGGTPGAQQPYTYQIDTNVAQNDHNFYDLAQGSHHITVMDGSGCHADTDIIVYAPLPVTASIDPLDTTLAPGSSITLHTIVGNFTTQAINSYTWTPSTGLSCIDCPNPVATPYQDQQYTVVVNYGKNCVTSATNTIGVGHGADVYIPNAFTPNGDGANDVFEVYGTALRSVGLRIFNRWGEKVYDSMSSQWAAWDGTYKGVAQPTGVYIYYVELTYLDGQTKTREGSITLIR
jgi:gliding motility-associated-like protein